MKNKARKDGKEACLSIYGPPDEVARQLHLSISMAATNRPAKIRRVYAELRKTRRDIPAHALLRVSAWLVDFFEGRGGQPVARQGTPRPTFEELPLDKAFDDGGWRVMERESRRMAQLYDDETVGCFRWGGLQHLCVEMTT